MLDNVFLLVHSGIRIIPTSTTTNQQPTVRDIGRVVPHRTSTCIIDCLLTNFLNML